MRIHINFAQTHGGSALRGTLGAFLLSLLIAVPALADSCFSPNTGAYADIVVTSYGIKGAVVLSSVNPATGAGIAHPAQLLSSAGGDFLGWGTKKGVGGEGGGCSTTGNGSWSIYADGISHSVYFCANGGYGAVANGHSGDTFQLVYATCFYSPYSPAFVFSWNGTNKTCKTMNSTTALYNVGGGESVVHDGQDITQRYYGMKYYKPGTGWTDFYAPAKCATSGYSVTFSSYTDWTVKK